MSFCSLACNFAHSRVILLTGVSRVSCSVSLFFRTRHTSLFYRARSFVFSVRSKQRKHFQSAFLLTHCLNSGVSFRSLPFVYRVILAFPCIHLLTQSPVEGHIYKKATIDNFLRICAKETSNISLARRFQAVAYACHSYYFFGSQK